jgi:glyoxylase-like metal-dependent hydrolase (beta-lactamase superfamily II)
MTRRALLCVATLTLCAACGRQESGGAPGALRLHVLDCGTMTGDPIRFGFRPGEVSTTDMPTPCFLVEHPEGTLLWDTGSVPDDEWTPTGSPVEHHLSLPDRSERDLVLRRRLRDQLAEIGYAPEDITYLALSHYHWDHVANANAFASATWLVREEERDTMFADVPPVTLRRNFDRLERSHAIILRSGDHDVFGDGTVVIKRAPGHTPGHQVLYVRLQRTGDVLLSGDLYHFAESRTLGRVPTFDVDQEQTLASRRSIEAFLADTGAELWIQHDAVGNALLRKSPQFYD